LRRSAEEEDGLDGDDDIASSSMEETGEMTVEDVGLTLFLRCIIVSLCIFRSCARDVSLSLLVDLSALKLYQSNNDEIFGTWK